MNAAGVAGTQPLWKEKADLGKAAGSHSPSSANQSVLPGFEAPAHGFAERSSWCVCYHRV